MVLIDNYTNYVWVYPLKYKSDTFQTFTKFYKLVKTQFSLPIKTFQCDLGGEFDNNNFKTFADQHGLLFRFACPQTSQQNGRSERMLRRLNDVIRALLVRAHLPPQLWVEAQHTAAYLHNILPIQRLNYQTPAFFLYLRHPSYDHLRTFGCACYPNMSATQPNKLLPRSATCVFLGYQPDFRGYRCYDPSTGRVHISRHVTFDENTYPFCDLSPTSSYTFLDDPNTLHPSFFPTSFPSVTPSTEHPTTPPQPNQSTSPPVPNPSQQPASSHPPITEPNITPSQPHNSADNPVHSTPLPPTNDHPMQTRSKAGVSKPNPRYKLAAHSNVSPIPTSPFKALSDPNWLRAMNDEFSALQVNNTWELVPRPANNPVIRSMWLFRHKFNADGTLERYKARLVCNGKSQTVGIDCTDTFSPVVKPATIRTVLSLAVSRSWPIHQLDVKNAFLNGHLQETVYMQQPPGFVNPHHPNHVCRLKKSLYGLKQAPRAWYTRFSTFVTSLGFRNSMCDTSLFIYQHGHQLAYLLVYVDDIVLTASHTDLLHGFITKLSAEFAMSDLGSLHHFLGITVTRDHRSLFLAQSQYARDILHRANMTACKPCHTPVDTNSKLSASDGNPLPDGTLYRSLAGALQYLTITRPDLSYAVQQICLFMHAPRDTHFAFMKRVLRYIHGTIDLGLRLSASPNNSLVAYSDADWGGCPDTRRSTSGYCIFMGDNLISWSSKRQATISRSSAEAEYRGVANAVAEATWIRNLLLELGTPTSKATVVFCDNISAVYLSGNPVQHQRTKHVEMDIHFVREKVQLGHVRVLHVPSPQQYADIFTKGLPRYLFETFRSSLNVTAYRRSS
ncbi:putative RNA-directed DNA polymerase [Helianthus debilis subsp. tardiflorus]